MIKLTRAAISPGERRRKDPRGCWRRARQGGVGSPAFWNLTDRASSAFRTDAIAFTVEAINNFKREFSRRHNIPANRIIVAMSSGLAMAAGDSNGNDSAVKALQSAVRTQTGLDVVVIDARTEADLTFKGIVPQGADRAVRW